MGKRVAFYLTFFLSHFAWCSSLGIDLGQVDAYIQERFAQATIFTDPYPHIYVEEVLPPELYDRLSEVWPEQELIQRTIQPRSANWRRILSPGEPNWENEQARKLWLEFAEQIVNPIIKRETSKILRNYLDHRFDRIDAGKVTLCHPNNLYDQMLIQDYGPVWFPHIDQAARFAALLFYFPRREDLSHQHMGTYVFRHKSNIESIDVIGAKPEDVETVRVMAYKPNSLFIIMQTPRSWHGPVFTDETGYLRRLYLSAIFLSPECMQKIYGQVYEENASDKNISEQRGNSSSY